jgi:hypothetical protein
MQADQIAAALSKAQRRWLPGMEPGEVSHAPFERGEHQCLRGLHRKKLAERDWTMNGFEYRLTPLGQSVRAILAAKEGGV